MDTGPCKLIAPIIANFATQEFTEVEFYKLNIETVPDTAQECGIRAMRMSLMLLCSDFRRANEYVSDFHLIQRWE